MLIYIDMDGVLCDLDGHLADFAGVPLQKIEEDREFRAGVVKRSVERLGVLHWQSLAPLDLEFWRSKMSEWHGEGHRLEILTSYGSWDPLHVSPLAHSGKTLWMRRHFGELFESGVLSGFNGVEKCEHKRFFSIPNSVLIDDQPENCAGFEQGPGYAVHYSNPSCLETACL